MKKLHPFLTVIILFLTVHSSAQVNKGALLLGGDFGGSTQKITTATATVSRQKVVIFSPVVGKAIRENLVFGGELNFLFNETDNSGSTSRQKNFGGGLFLRKYRPVGNSGFSVFIQGGVNVNRGENEFIGSGTIQNETKSFNVNLNARPGLSYAISRKLQLEAGFSNLVSLNYFSEKNSAAGSTISPIRTKGFSINSSLFSPSWLYIGFRLLINKKTG